MSSTIDTAGHINQAQEAALMHGVLAAAGNNVEQIVFTLPGPIDFDQLAQVWRSLVGRHAILHSGFRVADNGRLEIVRAGNEIDINEVDLACLAEPRERSAMIRELRVAERARNFDPAIPPLMRVTLVRLPEDGCEVIWSMCRGLLDWRSTSTLLREMMREYEARVAGADLAHVAAMLVPGIILADAAPGRNDDAAFWRDYLAGHSPLPRLELPQDPASTGSDEAAVTEAPLPRAIAEAARRLAKDAGVSFNNLMEAAWALLLANYADSDDIVFGLARCCRTGGPPGSEDAVGPFTNILPVRVRLDEALDAHGLLKQLQEQHRLVREHECASPTAVRRALALEPDQPLFDTVFEFDLRNPLRTLREMFPKRGPRGFRHYVSTPHGLHLQVFDEQNTLLRLHRDPARFDQRASRQLLNHFIRLVAAMAREPALPVRTLPYLEREEARPVTWPTAFDVLPSGETLASRFMETAGRHADRIAVSCGDKAITYAELDARSNALAARLRALGAARDSLVGLCIDRSVDQIVGLLAILKAGAGYLPLDPAYPEDRLAFLLADSGTRLVVTDGALPERLAADGEIVCVRPDETGETDATVACVNRPEDLAYVIYTSGSTGKPKGVQVTHRNVLRLFDACDSWLQAGPEDAWTMFHSFAFDFSVWEIWGALLYGGRLEVVPRELAVAPDAFRKLLAERGITVLSQTPSAFRQLQLEDAHHQIPLSKLRFVVFGGEALDVGGLLPWFERHGDESPALINMYGITETTVHVTWRRIRESDARAHLAGRSSSPVGWPLPDLYVRLLDSRLRPVPPGMPGEICVGGAGVTRGYLNRDDLNARHFVIDPHAERETRMYRSGDYARLLPNGELDFIGRRDNQVKIRGFRIDLGEVTATLRRVDGVDEGVVIARAAADGEKRLHAYYVSKNDSLTEAQLRARLAATLPAHMLPAAIIRVPHIPMNNNNKLDLKALPDAPEGSDSEAGETPATPLEKALAEIWMQVLERPRVSRDDDFFALGGDSISALRVVRLAREAGIEISPRNLFEHAGLSSLAEVARFSDGTKDGEGNAVIREDLAELTPIQHWFFEQDFDKPDHWNRSQLFRVSADCDAGLLERACLAVVAHHPALRTRYCRTRDGVWHAEAVEAEEALEFSRVELDHLAVDERREAVRLITREIQDSLSLSSGVLMRAAHFSGGLEDGDRLLLSVHQLGADASSWRILLEDINTAYAALAAGREVVLPPAKSASEWTKELARKAASPLVVAEQAYWRRLLDTPGLGVEPRGTEAKAGKRRLTLGIAETSALLGEAHRAYGTAFEDLLLAAFARAMAAVWPQRHKVRIDLVESVAPLAGRSVGWLESLRPFVLETSDAAHLAKIICAVKSARRNCTEHGMGFGMLRYLHPDSAPAGAEASPAGICVNASLRDADALTAVGKLFKPVDEDAGPLRADGNRLPHALIVSATRCEGRISIRFRYDSEVIADETMTRLSAALEQALREVVAHCVNRESAMRVPEDFPLAQLSQQELDAFPVPLEQVEDILPLAPIQRLHHALSGTDRDVGFDQWVFRLRGRIDETVFERAWQRLLARHDSLRTVFVDRNLSEPRQAVLRDVPFRLQRSDWRLLSEEDREARLAEFLAADRNDGFSMHVAPLTRVTLIRTGTDRWILVWSHHQAQVDGWSWPILARELGEIYDALSAGREPQLPDPGSYRSYIRWLSSRDEKAHADFWQTHLGLGSRSRSLISHTRRKGDGRRGKPIPELRSLELSPDISRNITRAAREFRITPSVLFQAAFALIIAGMTRRFDVTLGAAFSARTSDLPIADNTVGPFINDLPVHVRLDPTARIEEWVAGLRTLQADLNHFQNVSPTEIHRWTGNAGARRFFDTLLVFQNYATGAAMEHWGKAIRVEAFEAGVRTNYPLTISVTPGTCYRVDFHYDAVLLPEDTVDRLTRHLVTVLNVLTRNTDVRLETVLKHVGDRGGDDVHVEPPPPGGRWNRRAADRAGVEHDAGGFVPHASDTLEGRIAAVCREVLDLPDIRREENFFDLGAQSVSIVEIHARLQQALGRTFSIVTLFQHPSVAALARHFAAPEQDAALDDAARRGAARRALLRRRRDQHQSHGFEG